MKNFTMIFLVVLLVGTSVFAVNVQPRTYGTTTVDGDISEWTGAFIISSLHKSARVNKEVLGRMYAAYECDVPNDVYILYLWYQSDYPVLVQSGSEVWVKNNNLQVVTADDEGNTELPQFAWVNSDGTYADGWEAAIAIAPGTYPDFDFHANVWEGGESQTCGINNVELYLECGSSALDVEFSGIEAKIDDRRVTIQWNAIEASNHAGYNVLRKSANGDYLKVNSSLIAPTFPGALVENTYEFVDELQDNGEYTYKVEALSTTGENSYSEPIVVAFGVSTVESNVTPNQFHLSQNYPNPFNPQTTIDFEIAENSMVELTVFDLTGKTIKTLWNRTTPSGNYSVVWNGLDDQNNSVASGMYLYQLRTETSISIKQMTLIK